MSMINELTLKHQDGTTILALTDGGYVIENDCLAIAIQTESEDRHYAHFCIHNIPIDRYPVVGDVFETENSEFEDAKPGVVVNHAYFGFHAEEVSSKWTVWKSAKTTFKSASRPRTTTSTTVAIRRSYAQVRACSS